MLITKLWPNGAVLIHILMPPLVLSLSAFSRSSKPNIDLALESNPVASAFHREDRRILFGGKVTPKLKENNKKV